MLCHSMYKTRKIRNFKKNDEVVYQNYIRQYSFISLARFHHRYEYSLAVHMFGVRAMHQYRYTL